ncbi:TetR/AcrR family transcriptional regulator [Nonomuraea sp. CA-143628]|uniref:TetR/AcrR family transcriptional regulator n=1 Tax=Nonomuraea sp. CA-143628 TaxID=3239997 RepID=UPI003D8C2DAB
MTRKDDREQRRREIADALLRVAGTGGLHAATMRAVAAEAGVSLHLVQHYFATKEQLMAFALEQLVTRMADRLKERFAAIGATPREVVEAVLVEALPTDPQSRTFHLIYTSYAVLAMTDPALAALPFLTAPDAMEEFIATQLGKAGVAEPRLEAVALLAMSAGLSSGVLAGQRSADDALAALRHQLDRLCPKDRPEDPS